MDISQATIFDSEEWLSKALDAISRSGTAVFVTKDGALFGLIDDRNVRSGFSDVSRVKCSTASVKCPSIRAESDVGALLSAFLGGHFKQLPVVDEKGRVIGALSRSDLLRELARMHRIPKGSADAYMKTPLFSIEDDKAVVDAKNIMKKDGVHHLAVTHNGALTGTISTFDFLGFLMIPKEKQALQFVDNVKDFNSWKLSEVMRSAVSVNASATLAEAALMMADRGLSSLVVLSGGKPVGMLTATDIFKFVHGTLERRMDVAIGGLDEENLVYHADIRNGVLAVASKFETSMKIENLSVQFKKGKSIHTLHVHFDLDNKPVAFACEGYKMGEAISSLAKQLKITLDKAKSEKMERKKESQRVEAE